MPTLFDAVIDISADPSDGSYVLLQFPSQILAQSFVDGWVQTKHLCSKHKRAQAHVL